MNEDILLKAKTFAIEAHLECNHKYDMARDYSYHLEMVFDKATEFIYLIPEKDRAEVLAGCWVHDTLENTH
jgi:hypothetical protein